jgi:enamine deaminase RidA (YjgF/YER057c/UK114 family)
MELERINPENICPAPGYNHVVKAGNTIYIAGQVGRKLDGSLAGTDIESQTDQVFKNLISGLESVGAGLKDLVKIMVYLTDKGDTQGFKNVKERYLSSNLPAQTVVIVELGTPEFKLEIEAIAVIS